jgi:uncharacterized membrane protein
MAFEWVLEMVVVAACVIPALLMRPWRILRARALQNPWLACLVLLPALWMGQRAMPAGATLQLSGACLMVLMFGWPVTVLSLVPIALVGSWLGDLGFAQGLSRLAWHGMAAASLGLALGLATRRWLPHNLFVYILARGFFVTAVAMFIAGSVAAWRQPLPAGLQLESLLLGQWLMSWGEAVTTGMLTSIFVAFKPEWLASWSDQRYLHGRP